MNEAEIKAQANMARIVAVTNPFDFEYTHAWGGVPYTLPMGKTLLFPFPLADHLATHLARQALIRKAPMRDANEVDGKGKDRPLWSEESIEELKKSIMVEQYTEQRPDPVNESELMRRKIEELNKAFEQLKKKVDTDVPTAQVPVTEVPQAIAPEAPQIDLDAPITYKDKAEVIAELTKREIKFDARKSKSELEKLIT